jgi:hypothetical protein
MFESEFHRLYNGGIFTVKNVTPITGEKAEIHSDQEVFIDVDGE